MLFAKPRDEARFDRQLGCSEGESFLSNLAAYAVNLENDPARLHSRRPEFRRALARSHANLGRFLRDRHVRENPNPNSPGTLHRTRQRAACRFNLPGREPVRLLRLEAEGAEVQVGATLGP